MANNHFKFKQFTVYQDKCGMKVTTDACLFGGLVAEQLEVLRPNRILDIGTGTGLLSLMLAQASECPIEAIEIEPDAFEQAKENFGNSPWADTLSVYQSALQSFNTSTPQHPNTSAPYDLIICNPPFFSSHVKGRNEAKNKALHTSLLPFPDLADGIDRLLGTEGRAYVLLPDYEMGLLSNLMKERGFIINFEAQIFNKPGKPIFRRVCSFSRQEKSANLDTENILIRDFEGEHSARFVDLLKAYYLHL